MIRRLSVYQLPLVAATLAAGGAAWLCALTGCARPPGPEAAATSLSAPRAWLASYHGWRRCARLSNGLVRVSVVPQIGGRTLEYALGDYNFLFLGREELGRTLGDDEEARYLHFGGQFAQLHPEDKWVRLQSRRPGELPMGRYELRLLPPADGVPGVEVTSAPDLATSTRLTRRVELFPGSTRLRITDTLTNLRLTPQEWGIQAMLQLKGGPSPSGIMRRGEQASGDIALYVPLNPKSRFKGGVDYVVGGGSTSRGARQWSTGELPGLLVLHYEGELGKAVVDPVLPWVAFVDHRAGYVFVQTCEVPRKAIQSIGRSLAPYPFIEVQCFGREARLGPGESASLVQEWYAARCPGPVVDVTAAGVVASPLSLLRIQGRTWVAGTFGVFYKGSTAVVFQGSDGKELARLDCGEVTPLEVFKLNRPADVPPQARQVMLEVRDASGKVVGHLGRIELPAR